MKTFLRAAIGVIIAGSFSVAGLLPQASASTVVGSCSASAAVAALAGPSCGFVVSCPSGSPAACNYVMSGSGLSKLGVVSVQVVADNTSDNAGCMGVGYCATNRQALKPVPAGGHVSIFCLYNGVAGLTNTITCLVERV